MRTTMDGSGRLVVPREVRRRAGLRPGMPLEVTARDGRVEIEPVTLQVRLVQKGSLLVAVPEREIEPLTPELVEETRRGLLDERVPSTLGQPSEQEGG